MNFSNPIPRNVPPRYGELSPLASSRESLANTKLWQKTRKDNSQIRGSTQALERMQRQIAAMRGRKLAPDPWFPFKIYNYPSGLRRYQNDDDWRRVKVRMGHLFPPGNGLIRVYGTDFEYDEFTNDRTSITQDTYFNYPTFTNATAGQYPPDTSASIWVPTPAGTDPGRWNEIVVPDDGSRIYIWVCMCWDLNYPGDTLAGNYPFIAYGPYPETPPTVPATSLEYGTAFDDVWQTFPSNDPYHYMIGYVWVSEGQLEIRQCVFDNITIPFGGYTSYTEYTDDVDADLVTYCGEYSDSTYYFRGQSVSVTDSEWRSIYLMRPNPSGDYVYQRGPIVNIDPTTNTPDPWFLLSRSPIVGTFTTGAYDAAKYYLRHS